MIIAIKTYVPSKRSLRKLRKKSRAVSKQKPSIDDIIDNNVKDATYFYDSRVIAPDIQPYGIMHIARAYRNILIQNNRWLDCYQTYYDDLKCQYKKYVNDLYDFESYELVANM